MGSGLGSVYSLYFFTSTNYLTLLILLPTILKNDHTIFLRSLDWNQMWLLPNTAGSKTSEEAIRMAFLGHELACQLGQPDNFFVKLEVISDPKYLLPDPIGTLKAAEFLVKNGFFCLDLVILVLKRKLEGTKNTR